MDPQPTSNPLQPPSSASSNPTIPAHLFCPHQNPQTVTTANDLLNPSLTPHTWALIHQPPGLQRTIQFKTFAQAMKFITQIAEECKAQKHHPEWGNVYNKVVVRWTTHNPRGISEKDVHMAKVCDRVAREVGEVNRAEDRDKEKGLEKGQQEEGGKGQIERAVEVGREGKRASKGMEEDEVVIAIPSKGGEATDRPLMRDPMEGGENTGPHRSASTSEIAYPNMPPNDSPHKSGDQHQQHQSDDLLSSLLGPGEQICMPCMTDKEKLKTTGTVSGEGGRKIRVTPKDTKPYWEMTEGSSIAEEIVRKEKELKLAEPEPKIMEEEERDSRIRS